MVSERAAVWFVAEQREGKLSPTTAGLAAEARRIARALGSRTAAVLLGDNVAALAPTIPADIVYLGEDARLGDDSPEAAAAALAELVQEGGPSVLLLAATSAGSNLAPRLAARLGTGLASGCLRLDVDADGTLLMLRPVYGGRASCTVVCRSRRPQMATLLPDSLPAGAPGPETGPQVLPVSLRLEESNRRSFVLRTERPPPASLDVTQAEVVVAGGRGAGGAEGFHRLEELAGLLGGAVAASRPAVDAGWAPPSRQVGSSGKLVAPRLYIACGISGASQHLVGMRDSQVVVAINRDPYAPIISMAELALVGDLEEVLPPLLARLRQAAGPPSFELSADPCEEPPVDGRMGAGVRCIAVCLSRSLDPEARFDARNPGEMEAVPRMLSAADRHALEEALSFKDGFPPLRVVALHVGPPEGDAVLRQALALGADEAVLLWDDSFAGSDSLATARVLAAAVRRLKAGMVLCGSRGGEGQSGQLPLQLGELLGAAAVSEVLALSIDREGYFTVQRRLEWGRRAVVRCSPPAVLAVEPGINRPRYPRLRDSLRAQARPVGRWGRADLGLAEGEVGSAGSGIQVLKIGPPKPVTKGLVAAAEGLSAEERWQQLMNGGAPLAGQSAQGTNVVHGSPEQLAEACFRFLLELGFVRQ